MKKWNCYCQFLLLACALSSSLAAQPMVPADVADKPTTAPALLFRRVFIPHEDLAALIKGYMPLRRDDVESMIQLINRAAQPNPADSRARIQSAQYHARLRADELVAGTAQLQITRLPADEQLAVEELVPLSLAPLQLASSQGQWTMPDEENSSPAVFGCDAAGQPICLVPASGELQFSWSRRGRRNSLGEIRFELAFPTAPTSQLVLELPPDVTPLCDVGYLQPLAAPQEVPEPDQDGAANRNLLWHIDLGGHDRLSLTVIPRNPFRRRQQLTLLRQQSDYAFNQGEVELNAQFNLDVYNEPLRQLALKLDGLALLSARVGDEAISWTVEGQAATLVHNFTFPTQLLGQNNVLVIQAVGQVKLGAAWTLPVVSAQDVFWREGEIQLHLPADLALRGLAVNGGNVIRAEPDEQGGETRVIQSHQPLPEVELVLARRSEQVELQTALQLDISPLRATASWVGFFRSRYGNQFTLRGTITPGWTIDSLETEPAEAIDDYETELAELDGSGGRLQVKLKQAISPDREVQLLIRAHRTVTAQGLNGVNLQPVVMAGMASRQGIIAVQVDPPYQLQLRQDQELERLAASDLDTQLAAAINAESSSLIYRDGPESGSLLMFARQARPRYEALIEVRADVTEDTLQESYRVTCRPQSTPLNRVLLHFDESGQQPLQWQLAGSPVRDVAARQLTAEQQQQLGLTAGDSWELVLPEPLTAPFELLGQVQSELKASARVHLLSLPEASTQLATLAVYSSLAASLEIQAGGLKRIPAPSVPDDRLRAPRAMYRYQPSMPNTVELEVRPAAEHGPRAWIWHARMRSRFTTDGLAHHHAHYSIENAGRNRIEFSLPAQLGRLNVIVDGRQLPAGRIQLADRSVLVDLPESQRYVTVELQFQQRSRPLGMLTSVENELPRPDCPILDGHWEVLLPSGYHALDAARGLTGQRQAVSWGQRMFGPLWGGDATSGPLEIGGRLALYPGSQLTDVKASGALGRLDAVLGRSVEQRPATWGDLFDQLSGQTAAADPDSRADEATSITWWFDHLALQQAGVTATTNLPPSVSSFRDLVRFFHLRIVMSGGWIMLTTDGAPLLNGLPIRWQDELLGSLAATTVDSADPTPGLPGALHRDAWIALGSSAGSPWRPASGILKRGSADRNWTIYRQPLHVDLPVPVTIYHELSFRSLYLALYLVLLVAFSWLGTIRPGWTAPLALAMAALALLAPAAVYPFSTLGWLAIVTSMVLLSLRRGMVNDEPLEPQQQTPLGFQLQLAPRQLGILVVFFSLAGLAGLAGQEGQPAVERGPQQADGPLVVHRMLIPVDDAGEPTGQYNYVPEPFFDELHRRAADLDLLRQRWLISSARYVSSWTWSADQQRLMDGPISVSYQLHLSSADQRVELPIRAGQVQLGDVLLDGQPLQLEISPQDQSLAFVVDQAGIHELTLQLTPRRQNLAGRSVIEFDVPAALDTQLRLQLPPDAPLPDIAGRLGSLSHDEVSGQLVAELGPVDKLSLSWTDGPAETPVERQVAVEPYYWLRVEPHAVILDARFQFRVLAGSVDTIQLETDPRLRLISVQGGQSTAGPPRVRNDERQTILFSLQQSQQEDFVLEASFYLNQTSGIGNLQLPSLDVIADRVLDRRLGITVSDQLEWRLDVSEEIEEADREQFAEQWGVAETPQRALVLRGGDPEWNLATRYKLPQTTVAAAQDVTIGRFGTDLVYRASITTEGGGLLQMQLLAPADLELSSVSLDNDDGPVPLKLEQAEDGQLMVLLQRPLTGESQLRIEGSVPRESDLLDLPGIHFLAGDVRSREIRLLRRHAMSITLEDVAEHVRLVTEHEEIVSGQAGRLVASFSQLRPADSPSTPAARIRVFSQQPESQATLVSWLSREQNEWIARVDCELHVSSGVMDQLRLEIPEAWAESISVDPPIAVELRQVPGQSRRQLVLTPPHPFEEISTLSITFRVPVATEGFRIPDVMVLDSNRAVRYVVLPDQIDDTLIQWATTGLQRVASLPSALPYQVPRGSSVFIGVLPRFEADIRAVQQVGGGRQVGLADIRILQHQSGMLMGIVQYDLVPAGSEQVVVKMPEGYSLVHARIGGVTVRAEQQQDNRFELLLQSSQLPQRIEILFQADLSGSIRQLGSSRLACPQLDGVEPESTLWTIVGAEDLGQPQVNDIVPLDSAAAIRLRIDQVLSMIALSSELATVSQAVNMEDWYLPWQRHYLQQQFRLASLEGPSQAGSQSDSIADITSRYEQLQLQLGIRSDDQDSRAAVSVPSSSGEMFAVLLSAESSLVRFRTAGSQASVRVRFASNSSGRMLDAILHGLLSIVILAVAVVVYRRVPWRESLSRWPYAWGGLTGFAWWLCLAPSVLGLLLMILSAAAALRHSWGGWLVDAPVHLSRSASTMTYIKQ
jgi:hypothetical protein